MYIILYYILDLILYLLHLNLILFTFIYKKNANNITRIYVKNYNNFINNCYNIFIDQKYIIVEIKNKIIRK